MGAFTTLGIDAGTTSCKAAVFDEAGRMLSFARQPYAVRSPQPGWAEVDPEVLWQAVVRATREAVCEAPAPPRALSVSSQGEGMVPMGPNGLPVGPIIVSYDGRADGETRWLEERFGRRYFFDQGGQILSNVSTAAKILWVRRHPEAFAAAPVSFPCVGDYVAARLGVGAHIDPSLAARTMLYDRGTGDWRQELLEAIGITAEQLSPIVPAGTALGCPPPDICDLLGLPHDVIVAAGGHDQPCGLLGAGGQGASVYSLGTTETLVCPLDRFYEGLYPLGLPCYPHVLPGQWVTLPGNFTGGNLLAWYAAQFGQEEARRAETRGISVFSVLCEEMAETPTRLLVLPHFTVTGSPYNDSESCGAILNLHLSTPRGELIRGLLEGVAYEILLNLSLLEGAGISTEKLHVVGGGAGSRCALQLRADVLGRTLCLPPVEQAACRGAALLAAWGAALLPPQAEIWSGQETRQVFTPNPENHAFYLDAFSKYRALYPAVKGILRS